MCIHQYISRSLLKNKKEQFLELGSVNNYVYGYTAYQPMFTHLTPLFYLVLKSWCLKQYLILEAPSNYVEWCPPNRCGGFLSVCLFMMIRIWEMKLMLSCWATSKLSELLLLNAFKIERSNKDNFISV